MSTNPALRPLMAAPDILNETDKHQISRLTQIVKEGQERREREKNWREYESKDRSMIITYEIVDESYTDEFGLVEKKSVHVRRVMADVTLDENYSGAIEDLRIEIEAELAES